MVHILFAANRPKIAPLCRPRGIIHCSSKSTLALVYILHLFFFFWVANIFSSVIIVSVFRYHLMSASNTRAYTELCRMEGVRRQNVEKNILQPYYAFNGMQRLVQFSVVAAFVLKIRFCGFFSSRSHSVTAIIATRGIASTR
jgi:hypothetical protein